MHVVLTLWLAVIFASCAQAWRFFGLAVVYSRVSCCSRVSMSRIPLRARRLCR